ncbi:MAG: hypothetical protein KAT68_16880 [Bacteroidales bacterium]|nr:hypothetical protein [Bacteroidales bacterium]
MRKLLFGFLAFIIAGTSFAQPVSDNAIIPMSISLNSILRLNVLSGGNIEFVVNNINQYTAGIPNSAKYTTEFTVASSVDFDVDLRAESATAEFNGTDLFANKMDLDNVGYALAVTGGGAHATNWTLAPVPAAAPVALTNGDVTIITSIVGLGAGDIAQNKFQILWELGTSLGTMNASTLLAQSLAADRYTANIWLTLSAQ